MAKDQSFAAKVAKAKSKGGGNHCPECGELLTPVQLVISEKSAAKNSWKFNQKFVRVCKCNAAEVYG
ncbi:hypothetical protein MJD09_11275 [bacterium]|nr:hypothetical protein [bacterium]